MVTIEQVKVIHIGDDDNMWALTVNFEHKTVTIKENADPSVQPPDDVKELADRWQAFVNEKRFINLGVEEPEDAVKCVTPF